MKDLVKEVKGCIRKKWNRLFNRNQVSPESSTDYLALNVKQAVSYCNVKGKNVLVVGCNYGNDCSYFVNLGARMVCGLDVLENTGKDYKNERVKYLIESAEKMKSLRDNSFDLVFCFATLEHIPNINSAFKEMVRVARKGGVIYTVAAPLWNSAYGHHKKELFEKAPWLHLYMTKRQMREWFLSNNSDDQLMENIKIDDHINYMMDKKNMNQRKASEYEKICNNLNVEVLVNRIDRDESTEISEEVKKRIGCKLDEEELRGFVHRFVGIKK